MRHHFPVAPPPHTHTHTHTYTPHMPSKVLVELYETEVKYVRDLELIIRVFLRPLKVCHDAHTHTCTHLHTYTPTPAIHATHIKFALQEGQSFSVGAEKVQKLFSNIELIHNINKQLLEVRSTFAASAFSPPLLSCSFFFVAKKQAMDDANTVVPAFNRMVSYFPSSFSLTLPPSLFLPQTALSTLKIFLFLSYFCSGWLSQSVQNIHSQSANKLCCT